MIHYLPSSSPFSGASSCPSGSGECIPGDNCSCRTKYSSFHWMTTTFGCSLPSCFRSSICGESFRNWSYRCSSAGPSFRLESKHSYVFFYHIRPEIPVFSLHSPAIQLDDSTVGAGACFFFRSFQITRLFSSRRLYWFYPDDWHSLLFEKINIHENRAQNWLKIYFFFRSTFSAQVSKRSLTAERKTWRATLKWSHSF